MKYHEIDNIVKIDKIHRADNEKVVVIDFYRLTVSVDIVSTIIELLIGFPISVFIDFVRPCRNRTGDCGAWSA